MPELESSNSGFRLPSQPDRMELSAGQRSSFPSPAASWANFHNRKLDAPDGNANVSPFLDPL